uniref:NXPE family member 3-like n=1 Tax=Chlamydomonas euryale TaxID=1486919 RepID=A0A7R9V048_9CHLO|mmetsp:Transcript_11880/g.35068  ORF Transcript_11880/g.35068 Transcript_11880/m.35068 type:complete len:560 (+) Transcript_11880:220-1899(+)
MATATASSHAAVLWLLLGILIVQYVQSFDVDVRSRSQWRQLETFCPSRNYTSCERVDKNLWSIAEATHVSPLEFNGLGTWSTFKLTTFDGRGQQRTRGGDSWYIILRDRQQRLKLPTRVFDEGDGTYTVAVFFFVPGDFTVLGILYYSDCHGLQEPNEPPDAELKNQPSVHYAEVYYTKHLRKKDHCYVGSKMRVQDVIKVPTHVPKLDCLSQPRGKCQQRPAAPTSGQGAGPMYRMETYYYRQNHSYHEASCCKPSFPKPKQTVHRLLFYGDSTVKNSWELMLYMARQPCKTNWVPRQLFEPLDVLAGPESKTCPRVSSLQEVDPQMDAVLKRCTAGAPWTSVPVGTSTDDVSKYLKNCQTFDMGNFKYNSTWATTPQDGVDVEPIGLPVPREFSFIHVDGWGVRGFDSVEGIKDRLTRGTGPGDVLVVNIGPHYTRAFMFQEWKPLMSKVAALLKDLQSQGVVAVWRTSFIWKEHVFRSQTEHADGYVPQVHFNTDHRRLMFDSYAEEVLGEAGIPVWDVVGMCSVGDYMPYDMVHADGASCWTQNYDMMDLFACFD